MFCNVNSFTRIHVFIVNINLCWQFDDEMTVVNNISFQPWNKFVNSNSEDCQVWIDTINYAAASMSAPPLPGACGSQKKFQRPLMPSSYSRLSLVRLILSLCSLLTHVVYSRLSLVHLILSLFSHFVRCVQFAECHSCKVLCLVNAPLRNLVCLDLLACWLDFPGQVLLFSLSGLIVQFVACWQIKFQIVKCVEKLVI